MVTHPPWKQEYNQSYSVGLNPWYVTQINRGLGRTEIAKWEYCNVVPDHCIDQQISKGKMGFNINAYWKNKVATHTLMNPDYR